MVGIRSVCRHTSRLAARYARTQSGAASRGFSSSPKHGAASNFVMPAMSPTMTEGNIASWKVKEGDAFSTGDVLLEIETDKANMDVEAQDDGIMAKIIQQDGSKSIKVGSRIAVIAEAGDDIKSLEIPEDDHHETSESSKSSKSSPPSSSSSPSTTAPSSAKDSSENPSQTSKSPSQSDAKPQKYPLYPSVQHLLHTNGIKESEITKITATGPGGRLLKGDVLSYLGTIEKSYSAEQSKRISKLGHLNLSNIKPAKREAQIAPTEQKPAKVAVEQEVPVQVTLPISLAAVFATQNRIQESLGLTLPVSTFIARASEMANENLPQAKGHVPTRDELFDSILGLTSSKSAFGARGRYVPHIAALTPAGGSTSTLSSNTKKAFDIIDILSGAKPRTSPTLAPMRRTRGTMDVSGAENMFTVSAKKNEERRVRVYLERVKTILEAEPGRCVL